MRVPIVRGETFREAARPHNPTLDRVVHLEEGHGWHPLETQVDFWQRVEHVLAQHLAPR